MAQKTIYVCDRCGDESETENHSIEIKAHYDIGSYHYRKDRFELCEACSLKIGITKQIVKDEKIITNEADDLKDRLYDIFEELIQRNLHG